MKFIKKKENLNIIKVMRKSKGLSAKEFGEAIGVSDQVVYAWERGERFPSLQRLAKIAVLCDVSVSFLEECRGVHHKVTGRPATVKTTIQYSGIYNAVPGMDMMEETTDDLAGFRSAVKMLPENQRLAYVFGVASTFFDEFQRTNDISALVNAGMCIGLMK